MWRIIHKVIVVLLLSAVGLLFYYALGLITDEEFLCSTTSAYLPN